MRTRLLVPHVAGCTAVKAVQRGDWQSPWWVSGERMYGRRQNGAAGGSTCFVVFGCNSLECNARLIAHHDDLCAAAEKAAKGGA